MSMQREWVIFLLLSVFLTQCSTETAYYYSNFNTTGGIDLSGVAHQFRPVISQPIYCNISILEHFHGPDDFNGTTAERLALTDFSTDAGEFNTSAGAMISNRCTKIEGGLENSTISDLVSGSALFFSGPSERFVSTNSYDVSGGGTVQFYLRISGDNESKICEGADAGEDVTLQYSIDEGDVWRDMWVYETKDYQNWTRVDAPVVPGAYGNNTRFRWIQKRFTKGDYDHWAIDQIAIYGYPEFQGCIEGFRIRCIDGGCIDDRRNCPPLPSSILEGGTAQKMMNYSFDDQRVSHQFECFQPTWSYESTPINNTALRLTPSEPHQVGSAWVDVDKCFYVNGTNLCLDQGGDGFAFVIRGVGSSDIGNDGAELGYGGISNSLAIEFDTHTNGEIGDLVNYHVSIHSNGTGANSAASSYQIGSNYIRKPIDRSIVHNVSITYNPDFTVFRDGSAHHTRYAMSFLQERVGYIRVLVDGHAILSAPINLEKTISGTSYVVGFTAGTGNKYQSHDIVNWFFCCGSATCDSDTARYKEMM